MKIKNKLFPQCTFLKQDGKRCRRRSAIKHRVFLDPELNRGWLEVNLCPKHFTDLGGTFFRAREELPKT